jgi:regulatory protein
MSGVITAIESQKRHSDRVNIYLDDKFAFGLSNVVAAWLRVGQVLSDEKIQSLLKQEEQESSFQRALHFLSFRPRSIHEVREKLNKVGYSPEIIDSTISRLKDQHLLGDETFAQQWIDNRASFHPRSHRALRYELKHKGISDEVIMEALASAPDEEIQAQQAAAKYERRLVGTDWNTFRNRLGSYLSRLGFSYSIIKPVVENTWQKLHPDRSTNTFGTYEE